MKTANGKMTAEKIAPAVPGATTATEARGVTFTNTTNPSNPPRNFEEGQVKIGQVITLKAGAKLAVNPIALQMVRPIKHIDAIKNSIAELGQLTPCVVVELTNGQYQLVAGVTRKTACDQLDITCKCIVLAKMTPEEASEWVANEREASGNQRHLNAAQKALDAARLCIDVYEPAAQKRMTQGKTTLGETGESAEIAAKACGITKSAVEAAKKILDTPAEQLIRDGKLKVLSTGKKIAALPVEQQADAVKACREGRKEDLASFFSEPAKLQKDRRGIAIPHGGPLNEVFQNAGIYDQHVEAIQTITDFIRDQCSKQGACEELHAIDLGKLQEVASQITAARPHTLCPVCEVHGKDERCPSLVDGEVLRQFCNLSLRRKQKSQILVGRRTKSYYYCHGY